MKKGISFLVLIITIIVLIILAGTVILSLSNNNPIQQAEEAKFKSDFKTYESELSLSLANKYLNEYEFDLATITTDVPSIITTYIPSMTLEIAEEYKIELGKLIYKGLDTNKQIWSEEVTQIEVTNDSDEVVETNTPIVAVSETATVNSTTTGNEYSYNNPVIPVGFIPINTDDANWDNLSTDWNKGLVIRDEAYNQFVWVPVKDGVGEDGAYLDGDTTTVQYKKWCISFYAYYNCTDDVLPTGLTDVNQIETTQISIYHGFYIARYEAGKESIEGVDILVSKAGQPAWTNINYIDAKSKSESMYNNSAVVTSGLVTGTQWDTIMRWVQNSGKNVMNSISWGNYYNSIDDAATGKGSIRTCGYSEYWKANNIYDLAGNVREWRNEFYTTYPIDGGGDVYSNGSYAPAAHRRNDAINSTYGLLGFRVALYIL